MKIRKIFILAALAGLFAACNEDPEYYKIDNQPDQMHIKASTDALICNKGLALQPAITFTSDAQPSPVSPNDEVTYAIRFFASSNKSDFITDLFEVGTAREYTLTHEALNNIIGRWVVAGQQVRVTAQVLSYVNNETKYVKPASSTVDFDVTGYERFPQFIYIHMTDEITGVVTTQPLTQRQLGTGIYEVTLDCYPCTYHFTTTENAYPAYGQKDGVTMDYITDENTPINEFVCEEIGTRTIIVDTNPEYNDCRMLDIIQLPNGKMWIVGMGTSVGWNTDTADGKMTMTGGAREPYIWSWTGQFYNVEDAKKIKDDSPGQFKIGLGGGWSDPFLYAPFADADPETETGFSGPRLQDDGGDNKWLVRNSGIYTLTVYLLADDPHITFVPAE